MPALNNNLCPTPWSWANWRILFVCVISWAGQPAAGGDWPQILGPQRNGLAASENLADSWPKSGLATAWTFDLGAGFAGPAVANGQVIVFHRVGDQERVEALDAGTGRPRWKADFDATYVGGINPDNGPRCVPLIHDGKVYVFGAAGDLHAVDTSTGRKLWSRSTWTDYAAPEGYFGAGSSPIIVGGSLLVNVGGRDGAGIVAFSLKDGKTVWKATDELASYSSPALMKTPAGDRVVFVTRLSTVVLDPTTGKIETQFPFGARGPTVNAATPLVIDDQLFLSASYGVGARLVKIAEGKVSNVWNSDEVLSSQYNTAVRRGDELYGIHGREDVGIASLRCVELPTGRVRWSEDDFGVANLILADDKLLVLKLSGELLLVRASPKGFEKLGETKILREPVRALPALSNGRFFARDERVLKCVELPMK